MPTHTTRNPVRISESDFTLLARLTEAEAGGEEYRGRVAVAASVLNRVKSPDYPNTIESVIYQAGQYEPVSTGYIDRVTPSAETIQAVKEAVNGSDPSLGATVFYNPVKSRPGSWVFSRPKTIKIQNHQFAR